MKKSFWGLVWTNFLNTQGLLIGVIGVALAILFLIYNLSTEEILDPVKHESLGYLEIVKGTGKVIHVQERMATLESDKTEMSNRRIIKKGSVYSFLGDAVEEIMPLQKVPFDSVQVGDQVKPI